MKFIDSLLAIFKNSDNTSAEVEAPRELNRNPDISHFRDESGVSTHTLEAGLWFIKHRKNFVMMFVFILGFIGFISWSYSLYKWVDYFLVGRQQDADLRSSLASNQGLVHMEGRGTGYLVINDTQLVPQADNTIDCVAAVTNTNTRGLLTFDYYFDVNGERIDGGQAFVLPGDHKYLTALDSKSSLQGSSAQLVVENISLQRLDPGIVSRWNSYEAERLNFIVSESKFIPGQISGLSEKLSLGEVSFRITNAGAYGYKEAKLAILLKSGERIIGVTYYYLQNFRSGETRDIRFTWTGAVPTVSQIEIVPDINILDEDVYMRYTLPE